PAADPAVADPGKTSVSVDGLTAGNTSNNSAGGQTNQTVTGGGNTNSNATIGGSGQTNVSNGNSNNTGGQINANSVAGTGKGGTTNVTPPPFPAGRQSPTSSGTAQSDDTSVASGSGLALDNSVASGNAVAMHGSVASGCSVALDTSTASGGCAPKAAPATPAVPTSGAAAQPAGGAALAFTGLEAFQMAMAGALA